MMKLNEYKLLVPKVHPRVTDFAIAELNAIVKKSGLEPLETTDEPTAPFISLGNTSAFEASGLKPDDNAGGGFNVTTQDGNVYIYSVEPSGILNGVYRFCREVVGYRFYAMDEICVDKRSEYLVPEFDLSVKPDFMGRKLDSYALYKDPLYSARLRLNEACDADVADEYYGGEGTLWASLHDQSLAFQLIPRDEYKTEEYIKKGWWSEKGDQLCWTKAYYDEEMFELLCHNLIEVVKNEPTRKFYMLGQTDNYDYCTCETCKRDYEKYGVSGVLLRLVNKLADRVKAYVDEHQGGREHYLCMFAYQQTSDPPVRLADNKIVPLDDSVIARDNVMIRFAPVESKLLYSHLDRVANPISTMSLIGWRAVAEKFAIWDYGTDFCAYYVPFPDWDVLGDNLRLWRDYGAVDILTQLPAHTVGTEFNAMKLFVRSELVWGTSLDSHALMDEFIGAYYGSAGNAIKRYIELLRAHYKRLKEENGYTGHIFVQYNLGFFWPLQLLKKFESLFKQAKRELTEVGERRRLIEARIDRETLFYRHCMLENYIDRFPVARAERMLDEYERLTAENGTIAWKNGWRYGQGRIVDFIAKKRERLKLIGRALSYEKADNNPFIGSEYYKAWEKNDEE